MKQFNILLIFFLFWGSQLKAQSVYGLVGKYFCSFDLASGTPDTLIAFSDIPTGLGFRCAIDRYNGRYFYGGILPGHTGRFHIIDLVTLDIQDYSIWPQPDNIEYDFMRNRIVFEDDGTLYEIHLDSVYIRMIRVIEPGNGNILGQKRTYIPQTDQFVYNDYINGSPDEPYCLVIDAETGEVVCEYLIEAFQDNFYYPSGLVTNNLTGEIIAHHEGRFGFLDPCTGTMTKQSQVIGYEAQLNSQMAVYNHWDHTYIIPFVAGLHPNYIYKMGIVDVLTDVLLDVRDQPFDGRMNLQEIYDMPIAPIIYLRDTLFVPRGEHYEWYRDGILIGATEKNYIIPAQSGRYSAFVTYRDYTTFSTEVDVILTSSKESPSEPSIKIYPNPVMDYLTIENYEGIIDAVQMVNSAGTVVYYSDPKVKLPDNIQISVLPFSQGIYRVVLFCKEGIISKQVVRI